MKRMIVAMALGIALAIFTSTLAHAADCEFRLGFKTLRDLIGHDIVGECLENEYYNAIGDSNQHTTGGLMAWRKADNWTAFTDGYRTWINGSNGLVQRLNTERFEWEADYAPDIAATPVPITPVPVPTAIPQHTPPPVPTALPTPQPVPTARPQRVDPRLQQALDLIGSTEMGERVVARFEETGASIVFGYLPEGTPAHYDPNIRSVVFDESMRSQPIEVLAFILAHESWHAQFPWAERGEECFNNEYLAEFRAVAWWQGKYGDDGHPNTANEWIRGFNQLVPLLIHDLERGTSILRNSTNLLYADIQQRWADIYRVPPTFTPTPTRSTDPGVYDAAEVEQFFVLYKAYAANAIGELHGIDPQGFGVLRIMRLLDHMIEAMPMMYMMHMWAVGGLDSGHPLIDVEQFALAYLSDPRHYAQLTTQWLDDLAANPCGASAEERNWVIESETALPGVLRAYIEMSYQPGWLVEHAVNAALDSAAWEVLNDPNVITKRYGCGG